MNRATFAIVVPLLVLALFAIVAFDVIGMAFGAEGCRFQRDAAGISENVRVFLTLQILIFLPYWLVVLGLRKALAARLAVVGRAAPQRIRKIAWLLYASFAALTLNGALYLVSCHDGTWSELGAISKLMVPVFLITGIAGLALMAVSYVQGLRGTPAAN